MRKSFNRIRRHTRHLTGVTTLRLENLECRRMLAGDVVIEASTDGDLLISGDSNDNQFLIERLEDDQLRIQGLNDTTITQGEVTETTQTIDLMGVAIRDVIINSGHGDDEVLLTDLDVGRDFDARLGAGNDSLTIAEASIAGNLKIEGGAGTESISVRDGSVGGNLYVHVRAGVAGVADPILIVGMDVAGTTSARGSLGNQEVTISNSTIEQLNVVLGGGNDHISIFSSSVGVTYLRSGSGADVIRSIWNTEHHGLLINAGGGTDSINVGNEVVVSRLVHLDGGPNRRDAANIGMGLIAGASIESIESIRLLSPIVEGADVGPRLADFSVSGAGIDDAPDYVDGVHRYKIHTSELTEQLSVIAESQSASDSLWINGVPAEAGVPIQVSQWETGDKIEVVVSNDTDGARSYEIIILPPHFPNIEVDTLTEDVVEGLVYLTLSLTRQGPHFLVVVDNRGIPTFVRESATLATDFKVHPNGARSHSQATSVLNEFGRTTFDEVLLDEHFSELSRAQATTALNHTDHHDFLILPNGHHVFLSYNGEERPDPDMENQVRLFEDSVVQVVNPISGDEVFRWNSKDHVPMADVVRSNLVEYGHANSVSVDHDGNYLVSLRGTAQVFKIDSETGEVIWRLGGLSSDFEITDPLGGFCGQHTATRTPAGTLMVFDNGFNCPALPVYESRGTVSRAAEYRLDETTMTAELIWSHAQDDYFATATGSAQRLPNGSTMIGWGHAALTNGGVVATEVDAAGTPVFQISANSAAGPWRSYRAFRSVEQVS